MSSLRASYRDWRRLLSDIISALSVEYELAQRVVAGGKAYILVDGKEVASEDGKYVYRFRMEKLLGGEPAFTDVPVKVVDGHQNVIRGEILSIDGDVILLSLGKKPATSRVEMQIDLSFLLRELMKKLIAYRDHYTPRLSNLPLKVFLYNSIGEEPIKVGRLRMEYGLNEEQKIAFSKALKYDVSVVWGPPGTGKSRVLSLIAVTSIRGGFRVLLATHTHSALDRALALIVEDLERIGVRMDSGSIIRLGTSLDPRLARFEEEHIVSTILEEQKEKLQDSVERLRKLLEEWAYKKKEVVKAAKTLLSHIDSLEAMKKEHVIIANNLREKMEKHIDVLKKMRERYLWIKNSKPNLIIRLFMKKLWEARQTKRLLELEYGMKLKLQEVKKTRQEYERIRGVIEELERGLDRVHSMLEAVKSHGLSLDDLRLISREDSKGHRYDQGDVERALRVIIENLAWLRDFIREGYEAGVRKSISELDKKIEQIDKQSQDVRCMLRRNAKLVASTLTKCMTELFDYVLVGAIPRFNIALIDEVSMVNLGLLWVSTSIADRVVLFGDPNQLPPITLLDESKHGNLHRLQSTNFFEWSELSNGSRLPPNTFLKKQYRMGRRICELVSQLFYDGELVSTVTYDGEVSFYNTDAVNSRDRRTLNKSRINLLNALLDVKIVRELLSGGVTPDDIVVITPYRAQANLVKEVMERDGIREVRVGTVHTFQGGEKKIVVLDLVVSNPRVITRSPILSREVAGKMLATSMSRAMEHLILVGSRQALNSSGVEVYRRLVSLLSPREFETPILTDVLIMAPEKAHVSSAETIFLSVNEVYEALRKDISEAKRYVVIISPYVEHSMIMRLAQDTDIPVTIYVRRGQEYRIDLMKLPKNVFIKPVDRLHSKAVIIDDHIFYISSLNFLSPAGPQAIVYRTQSYRNKKLYKLKERYPPIRP